MDKREQEVKRTVLCFVFDRSRGLLLMIEKKRGQGAGKWNVPGGKIAAGESDSEAAVRETAEETGIRPLAVKKAGTLEFYFPKSNSWSNICTVFTCEEFTGELVVENEECLAHWISLDRIPYDKMWDDDRHWLPEVLNGRDFHRVYCFDANDKMESEEILKP